VREETYSLFLILDSCLELALQASDVKFGLPKLTVHEGSVPQPHKPIRKKLQDISLKKPRKMWGRENVSSPPNAAWLPSSLQLLVPRSFPAPWRAYRSFSPF